jgi:hypothetical protein
MNRNDIGHCRENAIGIAYNREVGASIASVTPLSIVQSVRRCQDGPGGLAFEVVRPRLTDWVEESIEETCTYYRLPRQHHKH